jgi:hypothetical protein
MTIERVVRIFAGAVILVSLSLRKTPWFRSSAHAA